MTISREQSIRELFTGLTFRTKIESQNIENIIQTTKNFPGHIRTAEINEGTIITFETLKRQRFLYIILTGKISLRSEKNITHWVISEINGNDLLGELEVFTENTKALVTAHIMENTKVIIVNREFFLNLMSIYEFSNWVLEKISEKLVNSSIMVQKLSNKSKKKEIIEFILSELIYDNKDGWFKLKYSQANLSKLIPGGMDKAQISKFFKKLTSENIVDIRNENCVRQIYDPTDIGKSVFYWFKKQSFYTL